MNYEHCVNQFRQYLDICKGHLKFLLCFGINLICTQDKILIGCTSVYVVPLAHPTFYLMASSDCVCVCVRARVTFSEKEEGEEEEEEGTGLLVDLEGKDEKRDRETNLWFSKVCLHVQHI